MITIRPYGGLGNRLRAIDSVVAFHQKPNEPVRILWNRNKALNCRFGDLFIIPEFFDVAENQTIIPPWISQHYTKYINPGLLKIRSRYFAGYEKIYFEKELRLLKKNNYDFRILNTFKSVYIESQNRFFSNGKKYWYLKPVSEVDSIVSDITCTFGKKMVGIHIRRTDNLRAIHASPLEAFISVMKEKIREDSETQFFLATDNKSVEKDLRQKFRNRIISYESKCLERNSSRGIKDALIDMLCLSKTKEIVGSYWSSFSEVSAELGNDKLFVVNSPCRNV